LGPQGVKAKYVRVELRKIETLPGVPPNAYYDFVGQSPINLWQSSEEYSMLQSVRPLISTFLSLHLSPCSPTSKISLSTFEYRNLFPRRSHSKPAVRPITRPCPRLPDLRYSQAGIKYELVGRVCIQGKSYVFPSVSIIGIPNPPLFPTPCPLADSSGATSQSFFPPLPQSSSTNTSFIPLGQSSNNTNHAISPKML